MNEMNMQQASKQFLVFAAGQSVDVVWIVRFGVYVFAFCSVGVCLRMLAV